MSNNNTKLKRSLGLSALLATGICSMLGASINVVPFMIQRNVQGIDSYVLPAFIFAMIPALFAALATVQAAQVGGLVKLTRASDRLPAVLFLVLHQTKLDSKPQTLSS